MVFNVPWPPNYGGVIDSWYRLLELARLGLKMHIHCFEYGRGRAVELEQLGRVTYYARRPALAGLMSTEPYIVSSRASVQLHNNLLGDEAPILFDGLHTCHYLADPQLAGRRKVVRMHNVEWSYYAGLAGMERRFFHELYYREESRRLKSYEKILYKADAVACISPSDTQYYRGKVGDLSFHLPAFHPFEKINSMPGKSDFALYHGNLSVAENVQAATFLIRIWEDIPLKLVIAGMDPDYKLLELVREHAQIQLLPNPTEQELDQWIQSAHVHVLPTFQQSGIKLKLLRALFQGRFVLVSPDMVHETGLEPFCTVADGEQEWKEQLQALASKAFRPEDAEERKPLELLYNNRQNALRLMQSLFVQRPQ